MKDINPALKEYIAKNILPRYGGFDKGHGIDHVNDVIESSLEIAEAYDVDINMVYTIAAYHDVGIKFGRKNHNLTSGQILVEDEALLKWFDNAQLLTMQQAVEDHRASNDYEPRTIYGKIISEADRQIDIETIVRRTIEFGKAHYPELSFEQQFQRTYVHIQEKYGDGGYLKLWLETKKNSEGLKKLRALLTDKAAMRELFAAYAGE